MLLDKRNYMLRKENPLSLPLSFDKGERGKTGNCLLDLFC
jgi:hypothetical protein